jgi:hypothetical protein
MRLQSHGSLLSTGKPVPPSYYSALLIVRILSYLALLGASRSMPANERRFAARRCDLTFRFPGGLAGHGHLNYGPFEQVIRRAGAACLPCGVRGRHSYFDRHTAPSHDLHIASMPPPHQPASVDPLLMRRAAPHQPCQGWRQCPR